MNRARAKQLEKDDKKFNWHPFTQMKDWEAGPVTVIEKGSRNYLMDTNGKRYLDGVSSLWCNVHGHRVPAIDKAIKKQLDQIAHTTFLGLSHVPAIELSKKLIPLAPKGLTRVFYSDSGSASVEVALKMSFQYWRLKGFKKKRTFLKIQNAYHGDTIGSVSVGGIGLFHKIFGPLLFKTIAAANAEEASQILKKRAREICAVITEPLVQGAAGMLLQPKGDLARLRKLTRKYGAHLIVDEVATGFGRTGKMFACEHEAVTPDFLCVAKGITAGYLPLSATLTTENIYKEFLGEYKDFKAFFHGHTYSANPLACAAALANLELFKKNKTLEKLQPKIKFLTQELEKIKSLAHVGDVRQVGFMAGIELGPYPLAEKRGIRVCLAAREKGVMLRPLGNVIVLMPPLSITESEIRKLCTVVKESIENITEEM
ncbi:MAG: adenosylmethionine--8-amino-7-oxononanoate transaminase [Candidatus Omnitrophica bacterium]|nr:adenosylmethionine--8-amino-7-oxononanoate transaminase [Candidatus Omnitrophota bacterium]